MNNLITLTKPITSMQIAEITGKQMAEKEERQYMESLLP